MNFNGQQPLGLPKGSVRAILALLIIVPITIVALRSGIQFTGDQVIGLASMVLMAYFVDKAAGTSNNAE